MTNKIKKGAVDKSKGHKRRKVKIKLHSRKSIGVYPKKRRTADFYYLNSQFEFFGELKNLILKSPPTSKDEMRNRISGLGKVRLAVLSGVFLNIDNKDAIDLFIVSDFMDRRKLKNFLLFLEAEVGTDVRFTVMEREEFNYRQRLFDRFLRVLFEGPHEVLIDKIGLEA